MQTGRARGGDQFIRVQKQGPFPVDGCQTGIAGGRKILRPGRLNQQTALFPAKSGSSIGGPRIDHHDFSEQIPVALKKQRQDFRLVAYDHG